MKPLTLTLQAFGSYAGDLVIDFRRLGRHGVFAITGPTGAGKSTIFDAIVYALYDDLPGFRVDGNVRSQYAEDGVLTRVVLEFEVHGESWCIERTPAQLVPRLRGTGGPIEHKTTVLLKPAGAESGGSTNKKAVAARIVDLVGLTKEQFEQVILIPQGKFEEVLKADTKDRALLLRRLFPIDIFSATTERLKAVAGERKGTYLGASAEQSALLQQVDGAVRAVVGQLPDDVEHGLDAVLEDGVSVEELAQVSEEVDRLGEILSLRVGTTKEEVDAAVAALNAVTDLVTRWEAWQAARSEANRFASQEAEDANVSAAIDRAKQVATLAPALDLWERSSTTLVELGPACHAEGVRLATALALDDPAALEDTTTAIQWVERLTTEVIQLDQAAAWYEALEIQRIDLADRTKALSARTDEREAAQVGLKGREEALVLLRVRVTELAKVTKGLEAARLRLAGVEAGLDLATKMGKKAAEVVGLAAELAMATRAEEQARALFDETFEAWRSGQAGLLADGLIEGDPCPTCGSTNHPAPAHRKEGTPGQAELEAADDKRKAATTAHATLAGRHQAASAELAELGEAGDLEVLTEERTQAEAELKAVQEAVAEQEVAEQSIASEVEALAQAKEMFAANETALAAEAATLAGDQTRWDTDRGAFVQAQGAYAPLRESAASRAGLAASMKEFAASTKVVAEATTARDQALGQLTPKLGEFGLDDPSVLRTLAMPESDMASAAAGVVTRRDRRTLVRQVISSYEEGNGPVDRPDIGPAQARRTVADERYSDLVGRQRVIKTEAEKVRDAPARLAAQAQAITVARLAFEEAEALADLCDGKGSGAVATKLSLENWVLADYLRRVLVQSNVRLETMTDGRYALELADAATDGRKAFGLDLAVFDVNTGRTRSATTLSGGETFMAALSLALGLADVVSGGSNREMGALFVDEGFGSLDPESLDAVIEVLRSLQDGGRIVGVISHVEELKQALPSGITIEGTTGGSVAEIHYPEE